MIAIKLIYYPPEGSCEEPTYFEHRTTMSELRAFQGRDEDLIATKARHAFRILLANSETMREELGDADT